jgi:Skp family chaperone for outer membrane proteins
LHQQGIFVLTGREKQEDAIIMSRLLVVIAFLTFAPGLTPGAVAQHQPRSQEPAETKDNYETSMEERFRRLGKSLDELHAKAAAMAEQARKETERSLGEAEKKRREAGRKLEEMRTEGGKRWNRFTGEMNAAMAEFEKAYERAKTHFKD